MVQREEEHYCEVHPISKTVRKYLWAPTRKPDTHQKFNKEGFECSIATSKIRVHPVQETKLIFKADKMRLSDKPANVTLRKVYFLYTQESFFYEIMIQLMSTE